MSTEQKDEMTSMSEKFSNYTAICEKAATDGNIFLTFKSHKDYTPILEHVPYDQGLGYIKEITKLIKLSDIYPLCINDLFGSPKKFSYNCGIWSATTLRYAKIAYQIKSLFKLEKPTIVEIGCGYGGQCLVMQSVIPFKHYYLIDLPQVIKLIDKYLQTLQVKDYTTLNCKQELKLPEKYDLVISNYAFSECTEEIQKMYLEKVIQYAEHGFLTINFFDTAKKETLIATLEKYGKKPQVIDELPLTYKDNFIVIW